uniref:Fibronectin type-III domain-containing protein n=1 Tax=Haptolina brevifila TaxID=156173 RepID=A0A7S2D925_9EUKA|mmetsp:Transcript_34455/g.68613  ORF Transcript_34455/g.68613 Transcript_34455/m.68613 type:complete len:481 (+) Transcript_34455:62-1504(+)
MAEAKPPRTQKVTFGDVSPRPANATVPGKVPGFPDVRRVRSKSISLHWDPPMYTGGTALTSYIVASREGGDGGFVQMLQTPDAVGSATVPVPPDTWLEFTVRAVNAVGEGEESRPSMPVLSRARRERKWRRRGGGDSRSRRRGGGELAGRQQQHMDDIAESEEDEELNSWQSRRGESELDPPGATEVEVPPRTGSFAHAANAKRYEELKGILSGLEQRMSSNLGRQVEDVELAASETYRSLAAEYVELRNERDAAAEKAAENRQWQQELKQFGFHVGSQVEELELQIAQWQMHEMRRRGGVKATVQQQLGSEKFVKLQQALVAEREAMVAEQRALDRVSSFKFGAGLSSALIEALEAGDLHASTDPLLRRVASNAADHSVQQTHALLKTFCKYDSEGRGALSVADFGRWARAELAAGGVVPLEEHGLSMEQIDDRRLARMHQRADLDSDGLIDFNVTSAAQHSRSPDCPFAEDSSCPICR